VGTVFGPRFLAYILLGIVHGTNFLAVNYIYVFAVPLPSGIVHGLIVPYSRHDVQTENKNIVFFIRFPSTKRSILPHPTYKTPPLNFIVHRP
jgi:hypothetical protein